MRVQCSHSHRAYSGACGSPLQIDELPSPARSVRGLFPRRVGRIRARCLAVRLPNPPVGTVRAACVAHGSREREFMVTSISSGVHRVHGVQLARSLSTLSRFPTLSLRAFALYVAFPPSDYSAPSDCLAGRGVSLGISSFLRSTLLDIPYRLSRVRHEGLKTKRLRWRVPTCPFRSLRLLSNYV